MQEVLLPMNPHVRLLVLVRGWLVGPKEGLGIITSMLLSEHLSISIIFFFV